MMTTGEILKRLHDDGFDVLLVGGDRLRITPASRLTDEIRALVRDHKEGLLSVLRDPAPENTRQKKHPVEIVDPVNTRAAAGDTITTAPVDDGALEIEPLTECLHGKQCRHLLSDRGFRPGCDLKQDYIFDMAACPDGQWIIYPVVDTITHNQKEIDHEQCN
jgi:hypothetical protein